MAHCPYADLADIEDVLDRIRKLEKLREKKPGFFYLKSRGFLHFHLKDDRRWADVRDGQEWGEELDIPFNPSKKQKDSFFKEVAARYENS